jgi:hypothetical protein
MPLIHPQRVAPERDNLSLRVDRALHEQLKAYAEFIASSKDHVISQALHRVFRQDKDFAAWIGTRPDLRRDAPTESRGPEFDVQTAAIPEGLLDRGRGETNTRVTGSMTACLVKYRAVPGRVPWCRATSERVEYPITFAR